MGRMCCEVGGFHDQEKRGILPPFPQPAKAGKLSPPDEVRFLFLLSFPQPHTGTSARNWTHKRAGHCEYPQIRGPPSHIILRRKGGEQATRRKTATRETEAKPIWIGYARYFDRSKNYIKRQSQSCRTSSCSRLTRHRESERGGRVRFSSLSSVEYRVGGHTFHLRDSHRRPRSYERHQPTLAVDGVTEWNVENGFQG